MLLSRGYRSSLRCDLPESKVLRCADKGSRNLGGASKRGFFSGHPAAQSL
jgi:hypothetical protein